MKLVVLGANSMLGWTIFEMFGGCGYCSPTTTRPPGSGLGVLDLADGSAMRATLGRDAPDLLIHCGAICRVEKCEKHPAFAHAINVVGTEHVLDSVSESCRLVYCSSDHVFSGDDGPYHEDTAPSPLSYYGRTRVEAEQLVLKRRPDALIVRAPLCVGPSYNGRSGHLDWLRYRHRRGLPMTVVSDEHRSAVWTHDAARRVMDLAYSDHTGLRHLWATRTVSRVELATYLNRRFGLGVDFAVEFRSDRRMPHLGRVEMRTRYRDPLAGPLPSVLD